MPKILANDGMDASGKRILENAGFEVVTEKVPQDQLAAELSSYEILTVRSATKVNKEIMEANPQLKIIGRGGVGLDNIDVEFARQRGIKVINTPMSSSASVAELVFAHIFSMARYLGEANRGMAADPSRQFNALKKYCSNGVELRGRSMGIIGFGRIGQETARIALGLGMEVLAYDPYVSEVELPFHFHPSAKVAPVKIQLKTVNKEEVLKNADFISLHVPFNDGDKAVIGAEEMKLMKQGVGIVNCARGGVVDEAALITALNSGEVAFAGLDVFSKEPPVDGELFHLKNISLSPHIGGSTQEAQNRIGIELAEKMMDAWKNFS